MPCKVCGEPLVYGAYFCDHAPPPWQPVGPPPRRCKNEGMDQQNGECFRCQAAFGEACRLYR